MNTITTLEVPLSRRVARFFLRLVDTFIPALSREIRASWNMHISHRANRLSGMVECNRLIIHKHGHAVTDGPFKGIQFTWQTRLKECIALYILGVYESWLNPIWEDVFTKSFDQILDVGANTGFYAVGLKQKFPNAEVIAFDTCWWARRTTRGMASFNQVKIKVKGACTPEWLAKYLKDNALIVSDCEGFEWILFQDIGKCTHLRSATLVIETHPHMTPGVTEELVKRFSPTHHVTSYCAMDKIPSVDISFLPEGMQKLITHQHRVVSASGEPQAWLYCTPRSEPGEM